MGDAEGRKIGSEEGLNWRIRTRSERSGEWLPGAIEIGFDSR